VLIVEDDVDLARSLARRIEAHSPKVIVRLAHDVFDAGLAFESFRPHALLLNLSMEGLNGLEVCQQLRQRPTLNQVRIVAVTSFPSTENSERLHSAGADAVLSTPLDPERVLAELGLAANARQAGFDILDLFAHSESEKTNAPAPSALADGRNLFGRKAQLRKLDSWARGRKSDPILLLHGPAGIGKTALCTLWSHLAHARFEGFALSSCTHGDSGLAVVYDAVLNITGPRTPHELKQPEAMKRVIELLRKRRLLVVIDDLDRMLTRNPGLNWPAAVLVDTSNPEPTGNPALIGTAPSELATLLQALTESPRSKILICSRLIPDVFLDASGNPRSGVRLESLGGLDLKSAQELSHAEGTTDDARTLSRLFDPVDFNPLVIRLVAHLTQRDSHSRANAKIWAREFLERGELADKELTQEALRVQVLRTLLQMQSVPALEVNRIQQLLTDSADRSEARARVFISGANLENARSALEECILADPDRAWFLFAEFDFLFAFDAQSNLPSLRTDVEAVTLSWQRRIWSALALNSPHRYSQPARPQPASVTTSKAADVSPQVRSGPAPRKSLSAAAKGQQLESAVARLFRTFFAIGAEIPWKIRRQKSGTQHGYDLSIEWIGVCETAGPHKVRVHIECKNYSEAITHSDIGGKLIMEGLVQPPAIHHWIVISPHTDPSNELNRFLEAHEKNPQYAFDVQVWSPESGVRDLFALEPEIYGALYGFEAGEDDPRTWSFAKHEEVRRQWMSRLRPPVRLPAGWLEYVQNKDKLCSPPEKPAMFQDAFEHAVPMRCLNAAGVLLDMPLRHYVGEWLERSDQQTLFILGEFGDGKTFFTYTLARDLMAGWIPGQRHGWLTLRLPLKRFPDNPREFLRRRLEEFDANIAGWLALGNNNRRLVILDGFDEMSVKVGPAAVTHNIGNLLDCVKEFDGCKVLITSRTHFFESRVDAQRLMLRLGSPLVYQLAPIGRQDVWRNIEAHLSSTLGAQEAQGRLARIERLNDPIGLAQKPLFLQMVKVVLSSESLPENLSIVALYERYIEDSLKRNDDRLDDGEYRTDPTQIIANLRQILGELAEQLQRSGHDSVSLSQFTSQQRKPFAELLWRLSEGDEEMEKDARTRVGARSLLGRVPGQSDSAGWLVDFCHRSMREYFVAIRLCEAVEASFEHGLEFLKSVPLNHEILHFATERWRAMGQSPVTARLLKLIERAVSHNEPGLSGAYALTLLSRLVPALPRDFDWRGKILDGVDLEEADLSGIDFTGSSLVAANLVNANLESTCFERCDLSGIQLEETESVVSLAVSSSSEEIISLYSDGTLREWKWTLTGKATSQVAMLVAPDPDSALGMRNAGQAWLRQGTWWSFLTMRKGRWVQEGTFPVREDYECIHCDGAFLTYLQRIDGTSTLFCRVDLLHQEFITSMPIADAKRCAPLGTQGFVWSDAQACIHFQALPDDLHPSPAEIIHEIPSPATAVATRQSKEGTHLLAIGTQDGEVLVWRVSFLAGRWIHEPIFKKASHQGLVSTLAFLNDTQIASGGSDRTVVVVRLIGPEGADERRLTRTLRCRNMRIEGCEGPREHGMLEEYIDRCQES
jgi:CheY-like chemotaxis protein